MSRSVLLALPLLLFGCKFEADIPWEPPPDTLEISGSIAAAPEPGQILVTWSDVTDAQRYNIYYAQDATLSPANYDQLTGGAREADVTRPFTLDSLLDGDTWWFVVEPENATGALPATDAVSATTLLPGMLPETTSAFTLNGDTPGEEFGFSIASDGAGGVVIGSRGYQGEGRVTVWPAGERTTPAQTIDGGGATGSIGQALVNVGDVDGNTFEDLVVGSDTTGTLSQGMIGVLYGSATGFTTQAINGVADYGHFGFSVAAAGDHNADTFMDVFVGSPFLTEPGGMGLGTAFRMDGSATGLSTAASEFRASAGPNGNLYGSSISVIPGPLPAGQFQYAVGAPNGNGRVVVAEAVMGGGIIFSNSRDGGVGDGLGAQVLWLETNGDVYPDILVGSSGLGRIELFAGDMAGITSTLDDATLPVATYSHPDGPASLFGTVVSSVGDVNGDGADDVIAGAPGSDEAVLLVSDAGGLSAVRTFTGNAATRFGQSVVKVPDFDGDGVGDLLVGAPDENAMGAVHVFLGPPRGPRITPGTLDITGTSTASPSGFTWVMRADVSAYRCEWDWGDGTVTPVDPCTPQAIDDLSRQLDNARTFRMTLRVEVPDADARWGASSAVFSLASIRLRLP